MTVQSPLYLGRLGYQSKQDRQLIEDIFKRVEQVLGSTDLLVTASGGMNVSTAAGRCLVKGDVGTDSGMYRCYNDAAVVKTMVADASNPRVNLIVLKVDDSEMVGSGADQGDIVVVTGTPQSGATIGTLWHASWPALPLSAIPLAAVRVGAAASSVVSGDIADVRPFLNQGLLTARPTAGIPGRIFRDENRVVYYDNGTTWEIVDSSSAAKSIIAGTGTRTNVAYGALGGAAPGPDAVTIYTPADGIIEVNFRAIWQSSVNGAGRAAIFVDGVQLRGIVGSTTPVGTEAEASTPTGGGGVDAPLGTGGSGLVGGSAAQQPYSTDGSGPNIAGVGATGRSIEIENLAAGAHTVEVMYAATSGSVTVKSRRLRAKAKVYG